MTMKTLHSQYPQLTAEERFPLILQAGSRNDHAEQRRLQQAGKPLTLSMSDHSPWAHAFERLSSLIFVELVEDGCRFRSALNRYTLYGRMAQQMMNAARLSVKVQAEGGEPLGMTDSIFPSVEAVLGGDAGSTIPSIDTQAAGTAPVFDSKDPAELPIEAQLEFRLLDHTLAAGCRLKEKSRGWVQFCRERNVPPFVMWEPYPGYRRLRKTIQLARVRAFTPNGYRRWLNAIRPAGAEKHPSPPLTAQGFARELQELYRQQVTLWGGEGR